MNSFQRSTANIAAWNLEGFNVIPDERIEKQIQGLSMMDAEDKCLFCQSGQAEPSAQLSSN